MEIFFQKLFRQIMQYQKPDFSSSLISRFLPLQTPVKQSPFPPFMSCVLSTSTLIPATFNSKHMLFLLFLRFAPNGNIYFYLQEVKVSLNQSLFQRDILNDLICLQITKAYV